MDDKVENSKPCTKCGQTKFFSDFHCLNGGAFGIRGECRACHNEQRRAFYAANKDLKRQRRIAYEARPDIAERIRASKSTDDYLAKSRASARIYKSKNREKVKEQRQRYYSQAEGTARFLMAACRIRGVRTGVPCTITEDWILERVQSGRCELSGIPFDLDLVEKVGRRNPFRPSVDQIVTGLGYTPENSRVVLSAVNIALADWGTEQFLRIAEGALKTAGYAVLHSALLRRVA